MSCIIKQNVLVNNLITLTFNGHTFGDINISANTWNTDQIVLNKCSIE